jgi:uncharacterized membrane protein
LAIFDYRELRRSLKALAIGSAAAVSFTALIVLISPLQAPTAEIKARTRPNLFDLAVAFSGALVHEIVTSVPLADSLAKK